MRKLVFALAIPVVYGLLEYLLRRKRDQSENDELQEQVSKTRRFSQAGNNFWNIVRFSQSGQSVGGQTEKYYCNLELDDCEEYFECAETPHDLERLVNTLTRF